MFLYSIQEITPFPDFELLDTRIASALNKIIPNSYFRNEVSQEEQKAQKQDRFLQGRQIAHLIYDYVPVTGVNDSVLYYSDLFSVVLRNNNIQESDTRWDEMLLSMEQLNLEIHQQKAKPDYHRMKTMVKRSIEQNLRSRNLGARNGRIESNILVKNQREQRRVHKGQEIVGNGKPQASVRRETNAVSGTIEISVQKLLHSLLLHQNKRRKHKV